MPLTMSGSSTLKALHDKLLAEKPADAVHDPENCPLCAMTDDDNGKGGSVSGETTYTEAELAAATEAATAAAVAARDARIKELEAAQEVGEHEAALAALRTEKDAEIAELQRQLDEATVEASSHKERADLIVAWLDEEKAAAEARETAAARRDDRLAKVKEAAPAVSQEYLDKHADRFAAMDDESFDAHLDSLREIASAAGAPAPAAGTGLGAGGSVLPTTTGLHAAQDTTSNGKVSAAKALLAARREHGRTDFTSV